MEYADTTGNISGATGIASMLPTGVTLNTIMADSMNIMKVSAVASTGVKCMATIVSISVADTGSINVAAIRVK